MKFVKVQVEVTHISIPLQSSFLKEELKENTQQYEDCLTMFYSTFRIRCLHFYLRAESTLFAKSLKESSFEISGKFTMKYVAPISMYSVILSRHSPGVPMMFRF